MSDSSKLFVTAASGQLGAGVIDALLKRVPASRIVAGVRRESAASALRAKGVEVRIADYAKPATLDAAFAGIDRLLLISSNDLDERVAQHANVIDAARHVGVGLIAYTSILHANTSPLHLASDHLETEALLHASGLSIALLRNGWYTENYAASIPPALKYGALMGSAGEGRISSAARADYAEAAAAVLAMDDAGGKTFELAGDTSYTLAEFAAELSKQSGKPVVYKDLPQSEYEAALAGAGLPTEIAKMLADSDVGASKGGLFDDGKQLSQLIGHPTTPLASVIAAALKK